MDIREIDGAIADLESQEATFSGCAKLADLYTVRDHLLPPVYEMRYSQAADPSPTAINMGTAIF